MIFLTRLEKIEKRVDEIAYQLSDPAVVKDQSSYQKLTKELAGLRPIVDSFREYRQAEAEITAGNYRGPLHGIPITLKDLFWTKGILTTAASKVLEHHDGAPADAGQPAGLEGGVGLERPRTGTQLE